MHLNTLREKLYRLEYTEDFVDTVIAIAYSNVFTKAERIQYAENWYIIA